MFSDSKFRYSLTEGPAPLFGVAYQGDEAKEIRIYQEDGQLFASAKFLEQWGSTSTPVWCEVRNGYFADLYARTFATEDRARVMEHAMMGHNYLFTGEFYAPMREKLKYYLKSIREAFDITGWSEHTTWEQALYE